MKNAAVQMPMAINTTATKSVSLAVCGTHVLLNENLNMWSISCQTGGPGLRCTRAITFRCIPSSRRPKNVANSR